MSVNLLGYLDVYRYPNFIANYLMVGSIGRLSSKQYLIRLLDFLKQITKAPKQYKKFDRASNSTRKPF